MTNDDKTECDRIARAECAKVLRMLTPAHASDERRIDYFDARRVAAALGSPATTQGATVWNHQFQPLPVGSKIGGVDATDAQRARICQNCGDSPYRHAAMKNHEPDERCWRIDHRDDDDGDCVQCRDEVTPRYRHTDAEIREAVRGRTTSDGREVRWVAFGPLGWMYEQSFSEPLPPLDLGAFNKESWMYRDTHDDPARAGTTLWVGDGADPREQGAPTIPPPSPDNVDRFRESAHGLLLDIVEDAPEVEEVYVAAVALARAYEEGRLAAAVICDALAQQLAPGMEQRFGYEDAARKIRSGTPVAAFAAPLATVRNSLTVRTAGKMKPVCYAPRQPILDYRERYEVERDSGDVALWTQDQVDIMLANNAVAAALREYAEPAVAALRDALAEIERLTDGFNAEVYPAVEHGRATLALYDDNNPRPSAATEEGR